MQEGEQRNDKVNGNRPDPDPAQAHDPVKLNTVTLDNTKLQWS